MKEHLVLLVRYLSFILVANIEETKIMSGTGQHVVPRGKKWAIRKGGAEKVTRRFDTQAEAIDAAREIARKQRTELYVHGRDGRIRERNSYGSDRFPPSG